MAITFLPSGEIQLKMRFGELKFEGHHLLSLVGRGEIVLMTPLFVGSDRGEVEGLSNAGLRPLSRRRITGFG